MDCRRGKGGTVIVFGGRGILLDVEGTTSSISFVYDVLFAFARQHVGDFLWQHRLDPAVQAAAAVLATETGAADATLADPAGTTRMALAAIELAALQPPLAEGEAGEALVTDQQVGAGADHLQG